MSTMQAMWAYHKWGPGEADRLAEHLLAHEMADVMAALAVLERTLRHWPHWSELGDVLNGITRRRREEREREKEYEDEPAADPDRVREHIAMARRIVKGMSPDSPMKAALERTPWS